MAGSHRPGQACFPQSVSGRLLLTQGVDELDQFDRARPSSLVGGGDGIPFSDRLTAGRTRPFPWLAHQRRLSQSRPSDRPEDRSYTHRVSVDDLLRFVDDTEIILLQSMNRRHSLACLCEASAISVESSSLGPLIGRATSTVPCASASMAFSWLPAKHHLAEISFRHRRCPSC